MFKTSKDYTVYEIKLIKVIKEASATFTYFFTKPKDLSWSEGAHTHLALDAFDEQIGWWQKKDVRHFSIMSLEDEDIVSITTRMPEPHTEFKEHLNDAKVGDVFYLFKVGTRLKLVRVDKPIVLLSAGVGIASLRPLIKAFVNNKAGITKIVHINIDSSGEYLFEEEFNAYELDHEEFSNTYVNSRHDFYLQLNKLLQSQLVSNGNFYIIGSDEFILAVRDTLREYDIKDNQLILDKKTEFYESW